MFFDILLFYYFNLTSCTISCLSTGDSDFSLSIYLSSSFVTVSQLFCCDFFESFVILLVFLLPIKSPVSSAAFLMVRYEEVLSASVADILA